MKKRIVYLLACCLAVNACSPLKEVEESSVPLSDQNASVCTSCTGLLLPSQTKIAKMGDNTVQIDLPQGYFFKAYTNDNNPVLLNSSVTIKCDCRGNGNGHGCSPVYRQLANGTIEYAYAQAGSCSSSCDMEINEKIDQAGSMMLSAVADYNRRNGYIKNRNLSTVRLEVGIGSPLDELERTEQVAFMNLINETSMKPSPNESLMPVVPVSSFSQLIKSAPVTEADLNDPEVVNELNQIFTGLKRAVHTRGIPDSQEKALVPLMIKNKIAYWQIPAAYVRADNVFGFTDIGTNANFSCSGCNGNCTLHAKKTLEYDIYYCKGSGCDCTLHVER